VSEPSSDEQRRLIERLRSSGFLPTIEQLGKGLTAPLWWDEPEETAGRTRKSGTVCFVHTGARLVGVTAEHIHSAISSRLREGKTFSCQLGAHSFEPDRYLIDLDKKLDLATYRISDVQLNAVGADMHDAPTWPPDLSGADVYKDLYMVGGYIWSLSADKPASRVHQFLHYLARLTSVTPTTIAIHTKTSDSVPWGNTALPPGTNLGGMSGGPIYRYCETGLSHLSLVGVVFGYHKEFEVVYGRPLSLVNPDGTINHDFA
jgi:hypothetical protein